MVRSTALHALVPLSILAALGLTAAAPSGAHTSVPPRVTPTWLVHAPNGSLRVIDRARHFVMFDQPAAFDDALFAAIRSHDADTASAPLDTAAILAAARPDVDAANAAWVPGLRNHDAASIAAAYSDSGLFIAGNGAVTRGRAAVAQLYASRFPHQRPIRGGGVATDGVTVLSPTRIVE
ncbi:MAG TPA: hypothetical protein VJO52_05770 [Gemmatimonadaceae bacterium]|nr:hypothetical protein [Gemmatimonadaceae bacterium]